MTDATPIRTITPEQAAVCIAARPGDPFPLAGHEGHAIVGCSYDGSRDGATWARIVCSCGERFGGAIDHALARGR